MEKETIEQLENVVRSNAKEYYTTGKQELSDETFDAVIEKIRENNPSSEVLTTAWGYKPSSDNFKKIKHKYCHISGLSKAKTLDDIKNFFNSKNVSDNYHLCLISAKLDGMSVVLYFNNGILDKAVTRGDGDIGIDITDKIRYIDGYTDKINNNFTGAIRGEIFMTPTNFNEYKLKHAEAKNHRNSAIGIINSDDIIIDDYKYLSLYVYTIVSCVNKQDLNLTDANKHLKYLKANFKHVVPYRIISLNSINNSNYYEFFESLKKEWEKIVSIDGLVITNQTTDFNSIQSVYNYKQIAFKFEDEEKITTVIDIEWTMSKHQAYIPVVNIEPIELEGTTVKRVTGYNAKWIKDMGVKSGSIVSVRKANQIIPQIVKVIS